MFTIFLIIIILYSIIFHEVAHGYAAYRNGDNTALNAGRLTLNPIAHIDMVGSIIIPILSYYLFKIPFGWAKPVPYNPNNIKHKKYAELEVSSAGILVNIFIATISVLLFYTFRHFGLLTEGLTSFFQTITTVNLFLALFNLLPFPPADGFSIFSELYIHLKDFFFKIKNNFTKSKEYQVKYANEDGKFNSTRNSMFHVKRFFSNPITMLIAIFIAIQIFQLLVPYLINFINYLYSF